jgi:anoctamin-8
VNKIKSHQPEGLDLHCTAKVHESTNRTALYVSAPISVLFKAAEEHRLSKRLKAELGGTLRDFTTRESHRFEHVKDIDGKLVLFTSQERQWLVLQVLQSIRASSADVSSFQGRANVEEGQSIVAAWKESGTIVQVFPLHQSNTLKSLQASWLAKFFAPHPIGKHLVVGLNRLLMTCSLNYRRDCILLRSQNRVVLRLVLALHTGSVCAGFLRDIVVGGFV